MRIGVFTAALAVASTVLIFPAHAQRCDIPREARDIWRCENGFVIGPENVIIRLPIPETDPEALYNAGIEAAQREDWRVAIAYFTVANERSPRAPRFMYNLGLAHARAGNKVAAIVWLTHYLIAAPDAPNRAAIWQQIATLESGARQDIAALWRSAREAVSLVPEVPLAYPTTARTQSLGSFRSSLVRAGDLEGLIADGAAPSDTDITFASDLARDDGDIIGARTLLSRVSGSTAFRLGQMEERETWLRGLLQAQFTLPLSPPRWSNQYSGLPGMVLLEPDGRVSIPPPSPDSLNLPSTHIPRDYVSALVATGRGREALELLDPANARLLPYGEQLASVLGEAALYVGDRALANAARDRAERFAAERERCVLAHEPGCRDDLNDYGWDKARLDAFLIADGGDWRGALSLMEAFASRRLSSRNWARDYDARTFAPSHRLQRARAASQVALVWFLVRRGRIEDVLSALPLLPAWERSGVLFSLSPVWDDVEGLSSMRLATQASLDAEVSALPVAARRALDQALRESREIGGAAYDTTWWLGHIAHEREPARQVEALAGTAEDLARGLRRAHGAYQLTGRAWGT
jgi:hypothetical protein